VKCRKNKTWSFFRVKNKRDRENFNISFWIVNQIWRFCRIDKKSASQVVGGRSGIIVVSPEKSSSWQGDPCLPTGSGTRIILSQYS
jgi:hypothetical protein